LFRTDKEVHFWHKPAKDRLGKRDAKGKKRDIKYIPLSNKQTNKIFNVLMSLESVFAAGFIHRNISYIFVQG
jgi:hypothetical protein